MGHRIRLALGALPLMAAAVFALAAVKACKTYQRVAAPLIAPRSTPEKPATIAADLRDVRLHTRSGLSIAAWHLQSRNGAAIIYLHGASADRTALLSEATALWQTAGYGALLFDAPGFGASEGRITWGLQAQDAVFAALDFIASQPDVDPQRMAAIGNSMGASVIAHAAAADPRVRAIVLEGAFTTLEAQLTAEFHQWGPVTYLPAIWACERAGIAIDQLRTSDVIARLAPRPQLFIAGDRDSIVPLEMSRALYALAGEPKELVVISGAEHGGYARAEGAVYYERLRRFFDRALR